MEYNNKTLSWLSFFMVILLLAGPISQFAKPEIADTVTTLVDFYIGGILVMLTLLLFKFARTGQELPKAVPFYRAGINYLYAFVVFFILTAVFFLSGGWGLPFSVLQDLAIVDSNWLSFSNVSLQFIVAGSEFIIFIFAMPYLFKWSISRNTERYFDWGTIGFSLPLIGDPFKFLSRITVNAIEYGKVAVIAALMHTGVYFRIFVAQNPAVDPYSAPIMFALAISLVVAFLMFIAFYITYIEWGTGASIAFHHSYNLTNDWITSIAGAQ